MKNFYIPILSFFLASFNLISMERCNPADKFEINDDRAKILPLLPQLKFWAAEQFNRCNNAGFDKKACEKFRQKLIQGRIKICITKLTQKKDLTLKEITESIEIIKIDEETVTRNIPHEHHDQWYGTIFSI